MTAEPEPTAADAMTAEPEPDAAAADAAADAGYRLLFEANPRPMWVLDPETLAFLAVNDAALDQYGYSREEFLALTAVDIRPPEDVDAFRQRMAAKPPTEHRAETRHRRKDGSIFPAEVTSRPISFGGRPARIVVASDLTRLRETESQLQFLAEHVSDVIFRYRFKPTPGFDYISPACVHVTGYTAEEYYADPDLAWKTVHPDDLPVISELLNLGERVPEPVVIRVMRKDGTMLWTEQRITPLDAGTAVAGIARDITDRVQLEDQLRMLALDDELTGLRNRRGFVLFANQLLTVLQRAGRRASLLFLDVDHLKEVNDFQGHAAGDAALVTVGRALRETFRDSDVIGRVGGDEFAVLLAAEGPDTADGAHALARLRQQLKADSPDCPLSVSGGVVCWDPAQSPSLHALMIQADREMYRDKRRLDAVDGAAARRRILVVDDLAEMRLMMRLSFDREERVEVVGEAADGDEAVRLARLLQPDVVLLDLRMPGTDGFDALPRLRDASPGSVVIVVTVLPPGPETERALSLGAHHCVEKSDFRSVVELVGALA